MDAAAPDASVPLLSVQDVTLQYKTEDSVVTATHRVGFDVYPSDRYILLGPSGCGKSTLLKAIGGYLTPSEGEIRLKGREVRHPGPDRMMVFQEFDQLLPWKTVRENVMFALTASGRARGAEARDRADSYIEKVGLAKFADSFPHMLSGGMKQRVAIARGMAMEPDVLLMDEPFAALDAQTREQLQDELLRIWRTTGTTAVFITHGIEEAVYLGQRVAILSSRPGRLKQVVDIDLGDREGERDLRSDPDFVGYRHQIWSLLHDEVERAQRAGHHKIQPDGTERAA